MSKVFFTNSGSEANDTVAEDDLAIAPTRSASRSARRSSAGMRAYHGVTIASASLTGLPNNHRSLRPAARRTSCTPARRISSKDGAPGESEEAFATRLAEELER